MTHFKRTTRPANDKYVDGNWVFDPNAAREDFQRAYNDDGVLRWKSNDAIPFLDMLEDFAVLGLIDAEMVERSSQVRAEENAISIARYREQANTQPSAEQLFEMRAAFGGGTEVVDIITGQRYKV